MNHKRETAVGSFRAMIKRYFKRVVLSNREAIRTEVLSIRELIQLLMKVRNTDQGWTKAEKREIVVHLKDIAKIVPAVAIFCLPGGSMLQPVLAEALDRRRTKRLPSRPAGDGNAAF